MDDKPLLIDTGKGLSIKYKKRYLYSKFNPKLQISKLIENITLKSKTIYLITSPLLGYGIDEIKKKLPTDSILLLIEIDESLHNLTKQNENVHFIQNGFSFLEILKEIKFYDFKKCEILGLNGGYELYKTKYDRLYTILLNQLHNHWKNRYTLTKMGQMWVKNCLINLKELHKAKPLSLLKTNKPIVIIGAGESTESVLNMLKENRSSIYIICVDTALQILLEVDITPDAVVALEGQFYNLPDFYGAKGKNIDLIYDLSSYPGVPKNLSGERYYTVTRFSKSSLLTELKSLNIVDSFLPPLGSVGISALYISLQITNNSIFVAGLDFSYLRGKTHSKGTPYHKTSLNTWIKTNPGDSYIQNLKRPLIDKVNKIGNIENTDSILFEYSLYAKELLFDVDRVYDLTTKGMDLGIPIINRQEFINLIKHKTSVIKDNDNICNPKNSLSLFKKEIRAINNVITGIDSFNNNKTSIDDLSPLLKRVDYLFDHYPEVDPTCLLNNINIKRFHCTLLRFNRMLGKL